MVLGEKLLLCFVADLTIGHIVSDGWAALGQLNHNVLNYLFWAFKSVVVFPMYRVLHFLYSSVLLILD